jgi:zinc protease
MRRLIACALLLAACNAARQGGNELTPTLPGEDPVLALGGPAADAPVKPTEPPKPAGADPWASRKDLIKAGPPTALAPLPLPALERFTLPSGLAVVVAPRPGATVSVHLLVPAAGTDQEPVAQRGVAEATIMLLTKGTRTRPGAKLAARASQSGLTLGANVDAEGAHLTCDGLGRELAACLELVADVAREPSLPADELERAKRELATTQRARRDDAQSLATLHVRHLLWGEGSPRGVPATVMTIEGLTQQQLVDWHARHFTPKGAILVIAGDVDAAGARALVTRTLGRWTARPGALAEVVRPAMPALGPGVQVRVIDRPESQATTIMIARPAVAHADEDYLAALLVNDAFGGGGPSARLTKLVAGGTTKLTGARSFLERGRGKGALLVTATAPPADAVAALGALTKQLDKLAAEGLT